MNEEFAIYRIEGEGDFKLSSTPQVKTLYSVNGRIELNDLKTLNERLHIVTRELHDSKNIVITFRLEKKLGVYNGYEELYYDIDILRYDVDEGVSETLKQIENQLKYVGVKYDIVYPENIPSFDSFGHLMGYNSKPHKIHIPIQIQREQTWPEKEQKQIEEQKQLTLVQRMMKQIGFNV